ncbi:DNA-binding transcriptional regulator, LacI/PurR family [Verrucomicrobium sp. GAS474]|uniref:substrate-binding domain-containing protein n=1 Tax=Verrucomicrobium sp. GAS474 TaxID=1882831 RepID=UPI0008798E36|nr:substrate-binding domain-containing protein [Verrucomicrobium sp. GAS474]SDU05603.1 DNA-binding transcriptional regulator, LacI/PurR family [Verrucomicrobium sp. GAS474]
MAFGTLVHEAETLLRNWLKEAKIGDGDRLPSERALAKTLGIRHYALNRAMARLVAEGLVSRQGYRLFGASQRPPAGAAPFTCHLVLAHRSIYLRSYRKTAKDLGIDLEVHSWETQEEAVALLHRLDDGKTQGVVFDPPFGYGIRYWEEAMARLVGNGIPAVCVGNPVDVCPSILGDYPRAVELAFEHLLEQGHREFALMCPPPWTASLTEIVTAWKNLCAQHGCAASAGRIQLPNNSLPLREDIADLVDRLAGEWNEVTALIDYTENDSNIPFLVEKLNARKKHLPRDLSLVSLRDAQILRTLTPPITVIEANFNLIQETAFRMVQRLARKRNDPGLPQGPFSIRIQPELILRGSTGPSRTAPPPSARDLPRLKKAPGATPAFLRSVQGPKDKAPRLEPCPDPNLETALLRPYEKIARVDASRFLELDLAPHMNRPLNFRRGWLGDLPLKNMAPGVRSIHGVPFRILGGPRRVDCGAVVFQSSVNTKGNAQELPTRLRVPIGAKVEAVYFLHGCGYARFLKPFATYSFLRGKKPVAEIALVPLGQPPADHPTGPVSPEFLRANIQDWWPDLPHFDFPEARMAPVNQSEAGEAVERHAYLYTLEWINPEPGKPIDYLDIAVNPAQSTTLGLLAVSALRTSVLKSR